MIQDTISLKIPHNITEKLDFIAQKEDRSRSSLIRRLIVSYVQDYEDITDALRARKEYKNDPDSAILLEDFMKKAGISQMDLDSTKLDD